MSRAEWGRAAGMAAFIIALHVTEWFTLVAIVAPEHNSLGTMGFGIGIGVSAYTLGMRHAFDADHIAAIDNTTRKLMDESRPTGDVAIFLPCSALLCPALQESVSSPP
ncbi:HoxN/HupN/NixA family nickel/cobalt transporter [Streptomyces avermitilis]